MPIFPDVSLTVRPSGSEQIAQCFQTLSSPGWGGREQRKSKLLFPLRDVSLRYQYISLAQAKTLWQFHLDRKGKFEAFNYFADVRNSDGSFVEWVQEYVGKSNGSRREFTTPSRGATDVEVRTVAIDPKTGGEYVPGSLEVWPFPVQFTPLAGLDGADLLTFTGEVPPAGSVILMTFTGRLVIRCRFAEDLFEWNTFYRRLVTTGVRLKGLAMN